MIPHIMVIQFSLNHQTCVQIVYAIKKENYNVRNSLLIKLFLLDLNQGPSD